MIYAGLDLHKNFSVITVTNDRGEEIIKQQKFPNNEGIVKLFQKFGESIEVAVEATRSWYWLYDLLEESGIKVKLCHPLKIKAIASARIKNDKIDSKVLAHLLRADLLPSSYIPEKHIRLQRELLRYRTSLVRIQTGIKNRIHSILSKSNISHKFSDLFGKEGIAFLERLPLPEIHHIALNGYLFILKVIGGEIKAATKRVNALAREDEEAKLLMTIPGVGYYSALLIKSEIGDINRFPSAKQLCSFAGIIPSTYASGERIFHGHITKQGSKWLRWILAEAIEHCLRKPGHLERFYHRMQRRKGRKIAKVATERKLLEWIYHMLKGKKTFHEMEKIAEIWGEPVVHSGYKDR